jgi:NurA-like 5'-3' nuclease
MSEWHIPARSGVVVKILNDECLGISQPGNPALSHDTVITLHPDEVKELITHLGEALDEMLAHPKV